MKTYQDHTVNGVASMYFGGVIHRITTILEEGMTDEELAKEVYEGYKIDQIYTNPITFKLMAAQAKQYGMHFVVGNITHWFDPDISVELFARASGAIADKLDELGYNDKTAAISLFNEPGKSQYCGGGTAGAIKYVEFCQRSNDYVKGRYPLILVNDEYHLIDEKYIFENTTNIPKRKFGIHHLSSLGSNPAWQNVRDAKTQANEWNVPVICTEGGSWFHPYQTAEGHAINVKLFEECKKYDYEGCALVLPDMNNEPYNGKLGYRIWNNNYTEIKSQTNWDKFEEVLKTYKEVEPPMPPTERVLRLTEPLMYGEDVRECQGHLRRLGFDLYVDGWYGSNQSVPSVKKFQELKGLVQDGAVGPITWEALRETEVADFYPEVYQNIYTKRDYSTALIDMFLAEYASTALAGHGKFFKLAENTYGEPVEWQLADAWQESVLGTSYHGRTKNNLYGWGITDSGVTSVAYFGTFAECINHVAKKVKQLYFDDGAPYNNGLHMFGKEIKYSTAPYNAIMKSMYYRRICSIMDAYEEPSPPVPATMEELTALLDKRYVIRTD